MLVEERVALRNAIDGLVERREHDVRFSGPLVRLEKELGATDAAKRSPRVGGRLVSHEIVGTLDNRDLRRKEADPGDERSRMRSPAALAVTVSTKPGRKFGAEPDSAAHAATMGRAHHISPRP